MPGRRGLVMIEAALIFPILLYLLMGLIEYGWLLRQLQVVTNAARHGARVGAAADATNVDIQNAVATRLSGSGISSGYTVNITTSIETLPGGQDVDLLHVTVDVDYEGNIDLNMPLVPVPAQLQGKTSMAKEGP